MSSKIIINANEGTIDRLFSGGSIHKDTGSFGGAGYLYVTVGKKRLLSHRLIWESVFGEIPSGIDIDHINGDKTDNRIANLRLVTRKQNKENQRRLQINNTTGVRGVTVCKRTKRFIAQIGHNQKNIVLGRFKTKEEAAQAYAVGAAKFHKYNPSAVSIA